MQRGRDSTVAAAGHGMARRMALPLYDLRERSRTESIDLAWRSWGCVPLGG